MLREYKQRRIATVHLFHLKKILQACFGCPSNLIVYLELQLAYYQKQCASLTLFSEHLVEKLVNPENDDYIVKC
jgi:hypothetical protein